MSSPAKTPEEVLKSVHAAFLFDMTGVVAVVTGGGTGIGLMISTTLMINGATVYIVGPDQTKLDTITNVYNNAAVSSKGKLIGLQGDIRSKEAAKRLAEEIGKREPNGITALFNNAGILGKNGAVPKPSAATAAAYVDAFWKTTQEEFENTFNTNAVGAYWLSFAFLPLLEKWKSKGSKRFVPQIIMTSSMNGWTKDIHTAGRNFAYAMSKSAIGHFTSSLAHELLPLDIRVNGIAPGFFQTEMNSGPMDQLGISHHESGGVSADSGFKVSAGQQGGSNRDMGGLALLLLSNTFINGETVLIDGGVSSLSASQYGAVLLIA